MSDKHDEHDHDHAHDDELEGDLEEGFDDEEDDGIVVLVDGDGNEVEYLFLDVVDLDGDQFALLTPAEEDEEAESTEIFIFRYEVDEEGGESFSDVEDEAIFQKVQEIAEKRFAEWNEGE